MQIVALNNVDKTTNNIFNLGSNTSFSVLQIIDNVENILHKKVNFSIVDPRPGDPAILTTNFEKAKDRIGWTPQKTITDIVESAYNWRNKPLY